MYVTHSPSEAWGRRKGGWVVPTACWCLVGVVFGRSILCTRSKPTARFGGPDDLTPRWVESFEYELICRQIWTYSSLGARRPPWLGKAFHLCPGSSSKGIGVRAAAQDALSSVPLLQWRGRISSGHRRRCRSSPRRRRTLVQGLHIRRRCRRIARRPRSRSPVPPASAHVRRPGRATRHH